MKIPHWPLLLFLCTSFFAAGLIPRESSTIPPRSGKDSVVIPFEYKQSALYQGYTMTVLDSIVFLLLENDSITLSIDGYAHQDEGNDTITKYLSLNRALFIRTYVLGRGIDSFRIADVRAHGKTKQLYRGTKNMGLGNCRAVIKLNYPPPGILITDLDGDKITDSLDVCPEAYGEDANEGCPDTTVIIVPFDKAQAALNSHTYKVLDSVITLLKRNPGYTLTIEGHAYKTEGSASICDRLSMNRAEIVKGYLLSRYIGASRIDLVKHAGMKRPITAGRTPQEIIRNSRAEIALNRHLPADK